MQGGAPYPRPFDGIETVKQAVDYLNDAFATQLEQATTLDNAKPNEPIPGDARVRDAFCALLAPEEQRRFFLRIVGERRFWPRLRTLVGTPPYSFLRPEDEGVLRASGICKGRVNMAHAEPTATSYGEFGKGHYEDAAGRLYRVITKERAASINELPWVGLAAGVKVVADVRVQKRTTNTKLAIVKGHKGPAAQASLVFPRVGDTLTLRLVPALRSTGSATGRPPPDEDDALRASVQLGRQKAPGSPVARLVLCVQ